MALIGDPVDDETPLTEDDLQGLKLPFVKTRAQLSAVEGPNVADILLARHFRREPFSCGGKAELGNSDPNMQTYLDGLKTTDKGDVCCS